MVFCISSGVAEYVGAVRWCNERSEHVDVWDLSSIEVDNDRRNGSLALPFWSVRIRRPLPGAGNGGFVVVCPD